MNDLSRRSIVRLLATCTLALGSAAWGQPVYRIEPIGIPDGSQAAAMNNRGSIVGYALAPDFRAALMTGQGSVRLLASRAGVSFASAVNESNVVAYNIVFGIDVRCGLWQSASGRFRDLGTLGGSECDASDLDGAGRVVGGSSLPDGRTHAFVLDGARMRDLGTLGGDNSSASGINDHGQITGVSDLANGSSHAFIVQGGVMTDLGDLGGGTSSGSAINALGHVAGTSNPSGLKGHEHAFLWDGSTMHDLGTLGGKFSYGWGMNGSDEVVGISRFEDERDPAEHAYLYTGGTMYSLLDLLDASGDGWETLINAADINDDGDIVGLGFYRGHQRAYLARRVSN